MRPTVPDVLCIARAVFSFGLFFLEPLSDAFLAYYILLWSTDILDGRIARWKGIKNNYGASLDSSCDAVMGIVLLLCIIPYLEWEEWILGWIGAILAIRAFSLGYGTGKYGRPAFVHTYLNKFAGFLLFAVPFLLRLFDTTPVAAFECFFITLSALEYTYINLTSETLDQNRRSVFLRDR